jgi:hypothetical protein
MIPQSATALYYLCNASERVDLQIERNRNERIADGYPEVINLGT